MRYFSPILLSIFSLVNGNLLLALSTCVFDMSSVIYFELQLNVHIQVPVLKLFASELVFFPSNFSFAWVASNSLRPFYDLYFLYWKMILKTWNVLRKILKNLDFFGIFDGTIPYNYHMLPSVSLPTMRFAWPRAYCNCKITQGR